jgi:molecular chaperone HscC
MHFGIDLGTTNSLIAVFRDGKAELVPNALGQVLTPSVVAVTAQGVVVGQTARELALSNPSATASVFKRAMGTDRSYTLAGKSFSAPELSALVLSTLKADAEAHLGVSVSDVVISVPAYFNEVQRKAVRAAGQIAGLNVKRLINEPTAAALAYGLHEENAEAKFLVFDLGGGTFDVSILDLFEGVMEVKSSAGDAFLGGEDFTEALARYIGERHDLDVNAAEHRPGLLKLGEQVKLGLSERDQVHLTAEVAGKTIDEVITRSRFDDITGQLMTRLNGPLDRALKDAEFRPDDLDKVVLVGGATRMPSVKSYVSRKLRKFPVMGLDPDHVVALGAAVQAALVARDAALDDVVMTDVSAFTLGVETSHMINGQLRAGYFAPIIERNTVVPVSREQVFQTAQLGQPMVRFAVFQGEAPVVAANLYLGSLEIDVPVNQKDHESVSVRFTYDISGLLQVEAASVSTGRSSSLVITKLAGEMSEAEIKAALGKLQKLKRHPRDDAANQHAKSRIEACYAMAKGDDRYWIQQLLIEFNDAIDGQEAGKIEETRAKVHKLLDRFEAGYVS